MAGKKYLTVLLASLFVMAMAAPLLAVPTAGYMTWNGNIIQQEDDDDYELPIDNELYFMESAANDGSVQNVISINLQPNINKAQFIISDDLVADGMVQVQNLPEGLTCVVDVSDGSYCRVILEGRAKYHQASDSVSDLSITFLDSAFQSGDAASIEGSSRADIGIAFKDNANIQYDGTVKWDETVFTESAADDGTISNTITVSLDLDEDSANGFVDSPDMLAYGRADVHNLPGGLDCIISTVDSTHVQISLLGQARQHGVANSVNNLEITFLDSAFLINNASWIRNTSNEEIAITFIGEEPAGPSVEGEVIESAFTVGSVSYTVNGEAYSMDVAPFAENGRAYVPLRYLAYCLGLGEENISYDASTQTATLTDGDTVVKVMIGSQTMSVNGIPQQIDAAPQAVDKRIFMPARFIVEAFGGSVSWNQETSTVTIMRPVA